MAWSTGLIKVRLNLNRPAGTAHQVRLSQQDRGAEYPRTPWKPAGKGDCGGQDYSLGSVTGVTIETLQPNPYGARALPRLMHSTLGACSALCRRSRSARNVTRLWPVAPPYAGRTEGTHTNLRCSWQRAVKVPEIGAFTSTRMRALAEAEVIQAPCGSVPDLPDVTLPMA
jgi:hypothetical protein